MPASSIIKDAEVRHVFENYPPSVQPKMLALRQLILDAAAETKDVPRVQETLKWGEPSYLAKHGSTLRIDWKPAHPDVCAMYFHCQTKLVDTFKVIYRERLQFEGNRAILFNVNEEFPTGELKHCVSLSLTYHLVKHLPLLGV